MKPTTRMCNGDEDYWRIRPFLREVFMLNDRRQVTGRWPGGLLALARVESWGDGPLEEKVALWELPDGKIVAVLNAEGKGEAYLQVHPHLPTPELEEEMI